MNTDQIASYIRSGLKIGGALLAAHGYNQAAGAASDLLNCSFIIGLAASGLGLLLSHLTHASPPSASGGASKAGGVAALFIALGIASYTCGCASVAPGNSTVVVRAEQSIAVADSTFDSAVHIDNSNRAFFETNLPAFHQFCEWLRTPVVIAPLTNSFPRGLAIVRSAESVKETYKSTRSTNDYAILISSLAVLESATVQAQQLIVTATSTK